MKFEDTQSAQQTNCCLIDWLTVVIFGMKPVEVIRELGMDPDVFVLTEKFRMGYPRRYEFEGISILFGADDPRYYDDPNKVRNDMGVCLNMSGSGCRAFETFGHGDWKHIAFWPDRINRRFRLNNQDEPFSFRVTRLDIAFDDHTGVIDIKKVASQVRDREYISKSKYSSIIWSDDQKLFLEGLTVYIGSRKSDIFFRFYDKGSEREFTDRHWIRCEIQLRNDRAQLALQHIFDKSIGTVFASILSKYIRFVDPISDDNRSRWPTSDWYTVLISEAEDIDIVLHPGIEYNFSRTQYHFFAQYGQVINTLVQTHGAVNMIEHAQKCYPVKNKKYLDFISAWKEVHKCEES